MKKKKYLTLYYKWMKSGYFRDLKENEFAGGLCNAIPDPCSLFYLFTSDDEGYWAYDGNPFPSTYHGFESAIQERRITKHKAKYLFTPLRQTIILFLAAMNGEL